jgi:DNA-binding beta-propeller fold protein YncE
VIRMRIQRLTFGGVAALLGVLVVGVVPASAKTGYADLCPSLKTTLCPPSTGTYYNYGVAVDNSSGSSAGDVWFASGYEFGNLSLMKFDASGNLVAEVGNGNIPETAKPFRGEIFGVAVDPSSGDVYASSYTMGTVTKFDSSGVFQFQLTGSETPQHSFTPWGVAVSPSSGDLYVADSAHKMIDKFSSSGGYIEQFPAPVEEFHNSLAAGPEGNLYMGGQGEVREYSSTGTPITCPGGKTSLPAGGFWEAVAVDPSDGHIFVGESSFIAEYSSLCATEPSAKLGEGEFGNGIAIDIGYGIGVSGSTHEVYASNWYQQSGLIFGLVSLPTVATGTPTNVTRTSATVNGTVSPEGTEITTCIVEYGPTVKLGQTAPCTPAPPFKGGPVTVSAELSFVLGPGDAIHYRLKTSGPFGEALGEEHTITREAPPTIVSTLPATIVSQFTATLNGKLETGEEVASYHFEYGTTTAYGQIAPIPDNYSPPTNEPFPVVQSIFGLQAGTTYHYRLVASSPGGTEVKGSDETFTTLPIPAPTVGAGPTQGVGVSEATLTGAIDPHGWDTEYLFEYGTSTAYGQDWPTVQVDMGALEGAQPVLMTVPDLQPGTIYHCRLVATNAGGTTYGPDMTFTTGSYPVEQIQEPVAFETLLVPSGPGIVVTSTKKAKKGKKAKQSKARHRAKRSKPRKQTGKGVVRRRS